MDNRLFVFDFDSRLSSIKLSLLAESNHSPASKLQKKQNGCVIKNEKDKFYVGQISQLIILIENFMLTTT